MELKPIHNLLIRENGKGIHNWKNLQHRCSQDGYNIEQVTYDPDTGVRRVVIERVGIDPRTGNEVRGRIKKTIYPPDMTSQKIDTAGDTAFQSALTGEPDTKIEPFGTKTRRDGSPADGYFEATITDADGNPLRVQGWFRENPDGTKVITSHAPRFDKNWPELPTEDW